MNNLFVLLDARRRRWLLPPLVRTNIPEPVRRNRFAVALWVFILYFPDLCLRGTSNSSHTKFRGTAFIRGR
ncbi:MAG: hypothetical protein ACNA8H_12090 [Anaerolineales bacterium]